MTSFLYIPAVLIDLNHHTKFQVFTIIGTVKSYLLQRSEPCKISLSQGEASVYFGHIASIFLLYT